LIPTVVLLLLAALGYWVSAGGANDLARAGGARDGRPITFATLDDIHTLDVGKMSWANDLRVAETLWEGLTTYDPITVEPMPGVAERWEITPDGKTYTFHLRPNAKWSNGERVTADDFLFAWRRVLTPSTGSDYISLFRVIAGAEDYTAALEKYGDAREKGEQATPPSPEMVGAKKLDDLTLEVKLKAPCTYFLDILAMPPYFPLNAKAMESYLLDPNDPLKGYDETWTRPPHLVSNGAFMLTDWRFKQFLQLEPNPQYWDKKNVHCSQLLIKAVPDGRTALLMYKSGVLDVLSFIPQEFSDVLLEEHAKGGWPDIHYRPVFGTYYYVFNCKRPPFDDKRVRRALSLAVNRDEIVERVRHDGQKAVGTMVPPDSIAGYASPKGLPMNVAEAQRLMTEAGFPGGKGFKTIDLVYNSEAIHGKIAQAIGAMWQSNLGISVRYRALERGSFGTARRDDHDFDIARAGWDGDYTDPTTWLDLLRTTDGNNDGKFSNAHYDELMDQAAAEPNPAKRFAILTEAERIIVEDELPIIPLYQRADGYMYDADKIAGSDMNVRMITELKWIRRLK
jgi:oligopeptide transport system substrate-binding protein